MTGRIWIMLEKSLNSEMAIRMEIYIFRCMQIPNRTVLTRAEHRSNCLCNFGNPEDLHWHDYQFFSGCFDICEMGRHFDNDMLPFGAELLWNEEAKLDIPRNFTLQTWRIVHFKKIVWNSNCLTTFNPRHADIFRRRPQNILKFHTQKNKNKKTPKTYIIPCRWNIPDC